MVELKRLLETSELKTTLLKDVLDKKKQPRLHFDDRVDCISLIFVEPQSKKIVHYLDENVSLLYDLETKEILGLMIESFERSFLPQYIEKMKRVGIIESGVFNE